MPPTTSRSSSPHSSTTIRVTPNPSKNPHPPTAPADGTKGAKPKPAHWADKAGTAFLNPWKSFRAHGFADKLHLIPTIASFPSPPKDIANLMPVRTPTWGAAAASLSRSQSTPESAEDDSDSSGKIKATWLGHACFLVEMPVPPRTLALKEGEGGGGEGGKGEGEGEGERKTARRGVRVLFDPVFSARCSPSQWIGPKRFTPPPCRIEDIPEIDAVVISHNHYDQYAPPLLFFLCILILTFFPSSLLLSSSPPLLRSSTLLLTYSPPAHTHSLDTHTIRTLLARSPARTPHFFAPRGNRAYFASLGVPPEKTHDMDWWESKRLVVEGSSSDVSSPDSKGRESMAVDITCTPGQHFTGRTLFDSFKSLWAGWAVEEVRLPSSLPSSPSAEPQTQTQTQTQPARPPVKVYFAGDTGYRTVLPGDDEDSVPVCPAFKEIGEVFGGFDLGLIPIGAYLPRDYMSRIHCAPQDSVRLFKDVKAKKALGMHWGTWILTTEDVTDPPKRLKEACVKEGIEEGVFEVCEIGETRVF